MLNTTFGHNSENFPSIKKWKNLNSIVMIKSKRELKDKTTCDARFYITSINSDAKKLMNVVRKHWDVENSLQWTLDMTFREDESRIRVGAAPENFAVMRHIALNLIKKDTSIDASVKRKRLMAALDDDFREIIVRQAI
ncbi:MAG: ISAs1 family transposase [Legionellales bacterium]